MAGDNPTPKIHKKSEDLDSRVSSLEQWADYKERESDKENHGARLDALEQWRASVGGAIVVTNIVVGSVSATIGFIFGVAVDLMFRYLSK